MRGSFRGVASAGVLAALLLVGCSSAATAPPGSSAQSCYAFGVRALERHVTVTAVPAACAGLSQATVNLAVSRAVREVAGPRPKAAERRLADREGARLAYLIRTVPPARPARQAAPPAGPGSQVPLSVAALVAWLVTAAAGSYLLAGWLRHAGWRRRLRPGRGGARGRAEGRARGRAGGMPPVIVLGHFGLAVTGLGLWIAFLASDLRVLAWTAAGLLLPTAGLGMATLVMALPEPAGPEPAGPEPAGPESARPEPAVPDPGRLATRIAATAVPAATAATGAAPAATAAVPAAPAAPVRVRMPVAVIALHGALATATMLLVLLAAIGVS
jgi:hypothetical protein